MFIFGSKKINVCLDTLTMKYDSFYLGNKVYVEEVDINHCYYKCPCTEKKCAIGFEVPSLSVVNITVCEIFTKLI